MNLQIFVPSEIQPAIFAAKFTVAQLKSSFSVIFYFNKVFLNMAVTNKFVYVALISPVDLIDSRSFTIDFTIRKFLHVGFADDFSVVILIITQTRHLLITDDFLKRMFNIMGNILWYLLDPPKYSRSIL